MIERFEVAGAGTLHLSTKEISRCGTSEGIGLAVSWGKHGPVGGVMDKQEMRRLIKVFEEFLAKAESKNWLREKS